MSLLGLDRNKELGLTLPTDAVGASSCGPVHSYFKREVGAWVRAQLRLDQTARLPTPTSQAALNGVRYEKKVLALLTRTYPNRLLPGPVLELLGSTKTKAIPDALLFSEDFLSCCIVEVKLRHTGDAWHQLNKFYLPIVRAALPWARVCGLEITSQYDPYQILPQQVSFVESAAQAFETREAFHPVWILTARDLRHDRGMV